MADLEISALIALVMLVVLGAPAFRATAIERALDDGARSAGLAVVPEVRPLLVRRYRATWLGSAIGTSVGIVLGALLGRAAPLGSGTIEYFLPTATWLVLGGIGGQVGRAVGARSARPDGPRVARERAVTVDDYLDPVERRAPLIAVGVATVMGGLPLALGSRTGGAWTAAILASAVLLAAVGTGLTSALVVSRPQRAGSTAVLAWDDAFRADALRGLARAVLLAAAFVVVVAAPIAAAALGLRGATTSAMVVAAAVVGVLLVLGELWRGRRRPDRFFLRRLWPATAAELAEHERPVVRS